MLPQRTIMLLLCAGATAPCVSGLTTVCQLNIFGTILKDDEEFDDSDVPPHIFSFSSVQPAMAVGAEAGGAPLLRSLLPYKVKGIPRNSYPLAIYVWRMLLAAGKIHFLLPILSRGISLLLPLPLALTTCR